MKYKNLRKRYKAHIFEHFIELQKRLRWCLFVLFFNSVIAYIFKEKIISVLSKPFVQNNINYSIFGVSDGFLLALNIAFFSGLILSLPVFYYQIYGFICPSWRKKDRNFFKIMFILSVVLFLAGGLIFNGFLTLKAVDFFMDFTKNTFNQVSININFQAYVSSLLFYCFCFGVVFQFPVLILILARYGVIDFKDLRNFRRIFIFLSFLISGIITPPDALSQIICAGFMILLYEILILITKKWKTKK
jgi:sec-independent protein translocase protein TatC